MSSSPTTPAGARAPARPLCRFRRKIPAPDLRLAHRLWRGRAGSGQDRLRHHRLLGALRPDGPGPAGQHRHARPFGGRHGRPPHRLGPVRRHRGRPLSPRAHGAGGRSARLADECRHVGQQLPDPGGAVRRHHPAPPAARAGHQRHGQSTAPARAAGSSSPWSAKIANGRRSPPPWAGRNSSPIPASPQRPPGVPMPAP